LDLGGSEHAIPCLDAISGIKDNRKQCRNLPVPLMRAGSATMNERERNDAVAQAICEELRWKERTFRKGDCVALLDGKVVAVTDDLDEAIDELRRLDPDPLRGMVFEVGPPVIDVIR
jgi:hypothetical protein